MKKQFMIAATCLSLAACGNKNESPGKGSATDSTATEEKAPGIQEDASILDPAKDDLSKPITTTQLIRSMNTYYGKNIQMIVYPSVYVDQEKCKQDMSATATADGSEKAVTFSFTTVPDLAIAKGKPYLLKGKITEIGYWGELKVIEAELAPIDGHTKTGTFNPKAISGEVVYPVQDIINSIKAWDKKAVSVTGDYWGSTVSKSADKTKLLEVRVDLQLPGDEQKVGCAFATEAEIKVLQPGQKNVTIQGEVDYIMHYGAPYLANCKIL